MILRMVKVRLLGSLTRLPAAIRALQDLGTIQVVASEVDSDLVAPVRRTPAQEREVRMATSALADIEHVLPHLPAPVISDDVGPAGRQEIAAWARQARRFRRQADQLTGHIQELEDELALLAKYQDLLKAFQSLFDRAEIPADTVSFCVTFAEGGEQALRELRSEVSKLSGEPLDLRVRGLPTGETAGLLVVPVASAQPIEAMMSAARVEEVRVPPSYRGESVAQALPDMRHRLELIPGELSRLRSELEGLVSAEGGELHLARVALNDRLVAEQAMQLPRATPHAFVVEGWLPDRDRDSLQRHVSERFGDDIVVEFLETEEWEDTSAPVVLSNPGLFRPFETIVRFLPLPRYGSIDPTPFVAFFFPVFFGLILGDAGYGIVLVALSAGLWRRAEPESTLRSVTHIAAVCGLFAIIFGVLFGEVFGDLGTRTLGLKPLWFHRDEALLPFLGLAVAIGFVHVVLGLVLGAVSAFHHQPRHALGRGLSALVVVLILLAILAAAEVLPARFFTPIVIVILVVFPVLVFAEGIIAPVEILAALSNIFSYARVMALGTASVMMAIVANRMAGEMGSAVVGVLFALLFHLVNFVLGVFSPTIHSLRLHYVEFFGKFYSPGGARYQPLRHWQPGAGGAQT